MKSNYSSYLHTILYINIILSIYIILYTKFLHYIQIIWSTNITLHSFFIRTKFIRMLSLKFDEFIRTLWTLKLPYFIIVLKVKYSSSKFLFLTKIQFFLLLLVNIFGLKWENTWQFWQNWTKMYYCSVFQDSSSLRLTYILWFFPLF